MQGRGNGRRTDRAQLFGAEAYGRTSNSYGNNGRPESSAHQEHANDMLEKQDLTIARRVINEGRVLVIAVNKWDLVKDAKKALSKLNDRLYCI